jgi:hypothetical protein
MSSGGAVTTTNKRSDNMTIDRRSILTIAGLVSLISIVPRQVSAADPSITDKADYTLRIANGLAELAPDRIASTVLYNDQFPGPGWMSSPALRNLRR